MGAFSDYTEKAILNATLRGIAFPTPTANVYVALFISDPLDDASGTELNNGTSPGYARVAVANAGWTAPVAATPSTPSTSQNVDAFEFPEASAPWLGPITHFALFDTITSGHMLYHAPMTTPRTIGLGDILRFASGALVVSVG